MSWSRPKGAHLGIKRTGRPRHRCPFWGGALRGATSPIKGRCVSEADANHRAEDVERENGQYVADVLA